MKSMRPENLLLASTSTKEFEKDNNKKSITLNPRLSPSFTQTQTRTITLPPTSTSSSLTPRLPQTITITSTKPPSKLNKSPPRSPKPSLKSPPTPLPKSIRTSQSKSPRPNSRSNSRSLSPPRSPKPPSSKTQSQPFNLYILQQHQGNQTTARSWKLSELNNSHNLYTSVSRVDGDIGLIFSLPDNSTTTTTSNNNHINNSSNSSKKTLIQKVLEELETLHLKHSAQTLLSIPTNNRPSPLLMWGDDSILCSVGDTEFHEHEQGHGQGEYGDGNNGIGNGGCEESERSGVSFETSQMLAFAYEKVNVDLLVGVGNDLVGKSKVNVNNNKDDNDDTNIANASTANTANTSTNTIQQPQTPLHTHKPIPLTLNLAKSSTIKFPRASSNLPLIHSHGHSQNQGQTSNEEHKEFRVVRVDGFDRAREMEVGVDSSDMQSANKLRQSQYQSLSNLHVQQQVKHMNSNANAWDASSPKSSQRLHQLEYIDLNTPMRPVINTLQTTKSSRLTNTDTSTSQFEQTWLQSFASSYNTYSSKSLWSATLLSQTRILTNSKQLSHSVLSGLCVLFLIELEPRICAGFGKGGKGVVDGVLGSVLKLWDDDIGSRRPSCYASGVLMERNLVTQNGSDNVQLKHKIWTNDGSISTLRSRLNLILQIPTHFDYTLALWSRLKKEILIRPSKLMKMQQLRREKDMEKRIIESSCSKWSKGILMVIFVGWKSLLQMKGKQELLSMFISSFNGMKFKDIFEAWKKVTHHANSTKFKDHVAEVREKAEVMKAEIKRLNLDNASKKLRNSTVNEQLESQFLALKKAKDKYNSPARNTQVLSRIIETMKNGYVKFGLLQSECSERMVGEIFRRDEDCVSLLSLYKSKHVDVERGDRETFVTAVSVSDIEEEGTGEYSAETDADDDVESTIDNWAPGMFKSVEKTPAFEPFDTKAGKRTVRWVNNSLKTDAEAEAGTGGLDACFGSGDLMNGRILERLVYSVCKHCPSIKLSTDEVMFKVDEITQDLQAEMIDDCNEKFYKDHGEFLRNEALLKFMETNLFNSCTHVTATHITTLTPPSTRKQTKLQRSKTKEQLMKHSEGGIIVHEMSQYLGQRVHVGDISSSIVFAMLAELFTNFYKFTYNACRHVVDEKKYYNGVKEAIESNRSSIIEVMNEIINAEPPVNEFGDVARDLNGWEVRGITSYCNSEIFGIAGKLKSMISNCKTQHILDDAYTRCLQSRLKYKDHLPNVIRLTWQSLCTTVLSRKVRIEEDIDDGSYTTLSRLQFLYEFRRLNINSVEEQDVELGEISRILKSRIRDLKRIFKYYAASGESGPATTMDNSEFWRLIKDCKLQKDRKKLPSVRVDLIFQACNIDYSLSALDRLDSDDGELDSIEFIEGLVRLAVYVRTKGSVSERLDKLINHDVLPNACSLNIDVFRERLSSDKVKDMLQLHKPNMSSIFKVYAAVDQSDASSRSSESLLSMNASETVTYAREMKLIGAPPLLSERIIKNLFAFCQNEEYVDNDGEGEGLTEGGANESEQVYSEFMETNAAVGCQLFPDPYHVMEVRIDLFLNEMVHPEALKGVRMRGVGLKDPKVLKTMYFEKVKKTKERELMEAKETKEVEEKVGEEEGLEGDEGGESL